MRHIIFGCFLIYFFNKGNKEQESWQNWKRSQINKQNGKPGFLDAVCSAHLRQNKGLYRNMGGSFTWDLRFAYLMATDEIGHGFLLLHIS